MKSRKINEGKRSLAIILTCLLIFGGSPFNCITVSHAADGEENAGTTEAEEDDWEYELSEGTEDGTESVTDPIYKYISSENGTMHAKICVVNENRNISGVIINKDNYSYKDNLLICVQKVDANGQEIQSTDVVEFLVGEDKVSVTKAMSDGKAVLHITKDVAPEGENALYWNDTVTIQRIGTETPKQKVQYNVLIDKTPPVLDIDVKNGDDSGNIFEKDNCIFYTNNVVLEGTASDQDTAIRKLLIYKDGKNYKKISYTSPKNIVAISPIKLSGNENQLVIEAINGVGNKCTEERECYRDTQAPEFRTLEIPVGTPVDTLEATIYGSMGKFEDVYEYFFHDETPIKVSATDGVNGCGVQEIEVYKVDGIAGDINTRNKQKLATSEIQCDTNGCSYVIATIPDGTKGQILVRAKDFLGNETQDIVCGKGVITESEAMHKAYDHISIQLPYTPYKDSKGQNLYGDNVEVQVTVTDKISGVCSVGQPSKIYNDNKNEEKSGYWEIFDKQTNKVTANSEWRMEQDANLAVKVQKKFTVSQSGNDLLFDVEMHDCADNSSSASKIFSIDKTRPVITVSFDNNEPDPNYPQVYNRPRTATISVREQNFSSSEMNIAVTGSNGKAPSISGWTTIGDKKNPENTVSRATVTFSEDDDYTMSVGGCDKVKNKADTVMVNDFTIDQTAPVINVTFDKNNPGNCYGEARTAVISITERNFAPERVKITGNLSNAEAGTAFPAVSEWNHNGDVHTATILCEADGDYQFEVECIDQAGNVGQKYSSETYIIDRTAPVIEITGVENFSANNKDVIPVVSITDRNYDAESVKMQLTGRNHGNTEYNGIFAWLEGGQRFTFENFPKESAYDDLYTLRVEATDLGGNMAEEEITFSVNRFGSVYVFDEKLTEIDGRYINREQSVKLREINVDSLERGTIDIIVDANGTPMELIEGENYKVQQSGGDTGWYCYDYDISEEVFAGDGRYIVTVYSEDRAGNRNQNTEESKKAEIRFGVDKTAPIVTSINVESNRQYPVEVKQATIAVNDNLLLNNVAIYVDGRESDYIVSGENYTFEIPNADKTRTISIVATDMAGNINNHVIDNVLVSTNLFARWYYNTKLFVASIISMIVLLVCGIGVLLLVPRRKAGMAGAAMGVLLIPLLAATYMDITTHAAETDPVQQKQTSVLQMVR